LNNITKNITGVKEVLNKVPSEESYYDIRQYQVNDSGDYIKREFPKKEPTSNKSLAKTNGSDSEMIAHRNYCKRFQFSNLERMQLITENKESYKDKPKLVEKYEALMKEFKDTEEIRKFYECTDISMTNNLDKLESIRSTILNNLREFIDKTQTRDIEIGIFTKDDVYELKYLNTYAKAVNLDVNYPAIFLRLTEDNYVIFCKVKSEEIKDQKDFNKYSEEFTRMFLFDEGDNFIQDVPYLKFTQTSVGVTNLIRKLNKLYSCMNKIELIKLSNKARCERLRSVVENATKRVNSL
jgi:hypothetical protein